MQLHRRGAPGATREVVTATSSTRHIFWDSFLTYSEEGVPFSHLYEGAKWPLAGRTPTLNPHATPAPGLSLSWFSTTHFTDSLMRLKSRLPHADRL